MQTPSLLVGIIALVVLALGGWWLFGRSQTSTTPTTSPSTSTVSCPPAAQLPQTITINYQPGSFSSTDAGVQQDNETFCVPKGATVTFKGSNLWVGSDPHPIHTDLAGFDAKGVKDSYSYTFNQVGEWGFHNHVRASDTGTIIVVE